MKRQWRIGLAVAIGMAVYASMSQAEMSILDDFSADSSGKYAGKLVYGSGTATYARNANNEFEPTLSGGNPEYVWYWNEGQKLRVGESVSLAFQIYTSASSPSAGINLCTNPATAHYNNNNVYDFYVQWRQAQSRYEGWDGDNSTPILNIGTQTGMSTITVTRVSPTLFVWSVQGGGLTLSDSYTNPALAGVEALYFGIMTYRYGGSGPPAKYDDLSYGTLPPRFVITHVGNANPTNESPAWTLYPPWGPGSWSLEGGSETTGSGTYDYWKIATTSAGAYYQSPWAAHYLHRNWVMEFKVRVPVSQTTIHNACVFISDGLDAWILAFRTDGTEGVYYWPPGGSWPYPGALLKAMDVKSDYHTYKMAMRQGATDAEDVVDVYIDGVLVTSLTRAAVYDYPASLGIVWGDNTGHQGSSSDMRFNYVRFDSNPSNPLKGTVIFIR
jgi:hypothetical protein